MDHPLRIINEIVDFTFIHELVRSSYCEHYGRPANEVLKSVVRQCIEKGLVKSKTIIVDSIHTLAASPKQKPLEVHKWQKKCSPSLKGEWTAFFGKVLFCKK